MFYANPGPAQLGQTPSGASALSRFSSLTQGPVSTPTLFLSLANPDKGLELEAPGEGHGAGACGTPPPPASALCPSLGASSSKPSNKASWCRIQGLGNTRGERWPQMQMLFSWGTTFGRMHEPPWLNGLFPPSSSPMILFLHSLVFRKMFS